MRRAWKDHSLTIILVMILLVWLAVGIWATWTEFSTNEGIGMEGDAVFWSREFMAYLIMQISMNYVPEAMGLVTIVLLTKYFRERFSAESK